MDAQPRIPRAHRHVLVRAHGLRQLATAASGMGITIRGVVLMKVLALFVLMILAIVTRCHAGWEGVDCSHTAGVGTTATAYDCEHGDHSVVTIPQFHDASGRSI